jgi:23S rRNA (adenine-N6)-dimethyltransferase
VAERRARTALRPHGRGQHFLRSTALARSLVEDARVQPGDLVVDVGAGRGIISAALLERGAEVWAVEDDPLLAAQLRDRFGRRVRILAGDARRVRWPGRPFLVVANLPFGGATEILRRLLDDVRAPLERGEVVLQWEAAAKRAAVWPSTLLGVLWGGRYELGLVRRLPRDAFAPPPAVDAGVLRITRREEPLVPAGEWAAYRRFVRHAFESRAPVRRLLPPRLAKRLSVELGFSPDARAWDLDAVRWAAVFRAVRAVR